MINTFILNIFFAKLGNWNNNNGRERLRIVCLYLLIFTFISIFNCCNNPSVNNRQSYIRSTSVKSRGIETGWIIKELRNTTNAVNIISTITKRGLTIAGSNKGLIFFNGHHFKNIIDISNSIVTGFDFTGNYLAYSVKPTWTNFQLNHYLFVLKIKSNGDHFKIIKSFKFLIPFSQSITGVKFLNNRQILVTSFLEYGIVKLNTKPEGSLGFSFIHYPLLSFNIDVRLQAAATFKDKINLIYGGMSIGYLHKKSDGKYNLINILYLDDSRKFKRADEEQIVRTALLDTSYGAFLTNNALYYFVRKPGSQEPLIDREKYIWLDTHDSISTAGIEDIKLLDDSDFVCITNSGLLLEQRINNWNSRENLWKVIRTVPVIKPNRLEVINKDSIIIIDQAKIFLAVRKTKDEINTNSTTNNNPYFSVERLPQPSTSYGIGIGDLENNGNEDIYIVDVYGRNKFFNSLPNLKINSFPDNLAVQRGIGGRVLTGKTGTVTFDLDLGTAIGDINEDGADDIILTNLAYSNSLYLNDGKGYFQDVTKEYNFNVNMWRSEDAVLGDVNNDGYLDVFCTSFFKSNKLFINDHGISLNDKTKDYGLVSGGRSISAVFGDVNNDGYLDLYVGNWMKENKLYFNNGKGKFIDHTKASGVGVGEFKETNSVFFADLNNDGYLDLFVGNRAGGDKLFLNNGDGTFKDVTKECGLDGDYHTYGAVFGDFENDGWQDIALACLGGIKYFKNLGVDSTGMIHFRDITDSAIPPGSIMNAYSTCLATADFGRKGFMDIVMNQNGGYTYFLFNKGRLNGSNNYLSVKVKGDESNRDAIGAKLKLYYKSSLIAYREISGGYGYASASSKIQHFGLGRLKDSLTLVVNFPASHITKKISVMPNSFITVTENSGMKRSFYLTKKTLLRFFYGNGFLVLGLELLIISAIFVLLISFSAKKLAINKGSLKGFYFNGRIILFSLAVFYAVKIVSVESMSFYFGPSYFIINSPNFFTDEILPLVISCIFAFSFLMVIKNKESKKIASYNVQENLLNVLKRFGHGEGMLIILHRLSLLIENLSPLSEAQSNYEMEALERIGSALSEYKNAVLPEVNRINSLLSQLDLRGDESIRYSNYASAILQSSAQITNNCELLFNNILEKDKIKAKEEAIFSIKKLRDELAGLRSFAMSNFSVEIPAAVELAIKKFTEQYPEIDIQYSNEKENARAVISFSDFNESLNILIQNAVDELRLNKRESSLIKVESFVEEERVFINVEDNGTGIPVGNFEKIFSEGFTTKPNGHGIGLSIVKKCLEQYDGSISAGKSKIGGALFVMKLKVV